MILSFDSPLCPYHIDRCKTGSYGEEYYGNECRCTICNKPIKRDEECYEVDGELYCKSCEEYADEAILNKVRKEYLTVA